MQGPFSEELNIAMLHQFDCKYLVTKETGKAGGFEENGMLFQVKDLTFLVIGSSYEKDLSQRERNTADFLIANGLPESDTGGTYLTTILAREEDELQTLWNRTYLEQETVNLYTTGGKGSIVIDVAGNQQISVRREN